MTEAEIYLAANLRTVREMISMMWVMTPDKPGDHIKDEEFNAVYKLLKRWEERLELELTAKLYGESA